MGKELIVVATSDATVERSARMRRTAMHVCGVALLLGVMVALAAASGNAYVLDMKAVIPGASALTFPAAVQVDVHKGVNPGNLKGTSTADFDGSALSNIVCDGVVCITDAMVVDDEVIVYYTAFGYKDGRFDNDTVFAVTIGELSAASHVHTGCEKPMYVGAPYGTEPFAQGTFFILGGDGDCLWEDEGCPANVHKIHWFFGYMLVPGTQPETLTFELYDAQLNELRAMATAELGGYVLSGQFNNVHGRLIDADILGDDLKVYFYVMGWESRGEFGNESSMVLHVGEAEYTLNIHTSCSEEILTGVPYPLEPEGELVFLNGCASCLGYVPVEDSSWGTIKGLYR